MFVANLNPGRKLKIFHSISRKNGHMFFHERHKKGSVFVFTNPLRNYFDLVKNTFSEHQAVERQKLTEPDF